MRKKLFVILIITSLLITFTIHTSAEVDFTQELYSKLSENTNPIPYLDIPNYNSAVFHNGLKIYLLEDHSLPYIDIKGYIKGGRILENEDNAGITDFMTAVMNTGTQNYGEKELNRFKELNAVDLNLSSSDHYISFSGNALTSEKNKLIFLLKEILLRPNFAAEYRSRLLAERERNIQQSKTRQNSLLEMYFFKNIYLGHPYSYAHDLDLLLDNLDYYTPENLKKYYDKTVRPNKTIMILYGDFDSKKMLKKLHKEFSSWKNSSEFWKQPTVTAEESNYGKVILINKEDATQAKIKMGYNLDIRYFKDRIAFTLGNEIFGGGDLTSRLSKNLRAEKGLVYNIYSKYVDKKAGGYYILNTSVKPEKTYLAVESINKEIEKIIQGKEQITEDDIFEIVNRRNVFFPKSYRRKEDLLQSVIFNIEFKERDKNYINKFIQAYNILSAEDVNKYFEKYIYPGRFLTVIVGKKEDILPQFEENSISVEVIEID
ncbi:MULTISPECIES: pitrilysin family protein [unclassified Halanaerobium]|uniref:M16 family metallopeptidase n=1 Tax=unclassified Halanaerobium TaxID=2641197 RepID=UPI000DF28339|nr:MULTISPECIES: pitrilysin family protein [unclassified Halanaerobium]RCW47730.1 zinc protease [Halanaerobium sp. MA284_MarDTE_T2]RCW87983.1 zinc protease [Halanaerobium sp. DL-01]